MKFTLLTALFLLPVSHAFAEGETTETPKIADKTTVEPPAATVEESKGLFDRVREAHTRAVQRGVVVTAPKT